MSVSPSAQHLLGTAETEQKPDLKWEPRHLSQWNIGKVSVNVLNAFIAIMIGLQDIFKLSHFDMVWKKRLIQLAKAYRIHT